MGGFQGIRQATEQPVGGCLSTTYPASITQVEVYDSTILIQGNVDAGKGSRLLCAVRPWESPLNAGELDGTEITGKSFTVERPRYEEIDGFNYDHALSDG